MLTQGLRIGASVSSLVICMWLVACGDDNGGGPPGTTGGGGGSTPVTKLVYLADQDIDGVNELYLVGSSIKLNPSLPAGRAVFDDYEILPDQSGVVYRADQDNDNVIELYLVKFDNPGVSTKLNPSLTGAQDVSSFAPSFHVIPDSSGVVYHADQETDEVVELYWVKFSSPGTSTKLNGPLVTGGDVSSFEMLPNSSGVVYVADQDIDEKTELFLVRFTSPGTSQKLNPSLANDRDVIGPHVLPDSTGVVYLASETSTSLDLYRVLFSAPGSSTKLNGLFTGTFSSLVLPAITPDGTGVVFLGPGDPGPGQELYRATFANPGVNIKLNSTLTTGGVVLRYLLIPDSSGVIYFATQDTAGVFELYRTNFATPGTSVKMSGPPLGERRFSPLFVVAPDSQSVVYAVYLGASQAELRHVNLATPGATTLLQGPPLSFAFGPSGGVAMAEMAVTPDSKGLFYVGHEVAGVDELFQVNFATPATATKLSGPLVTNGDVKNFVAR